MEQPENNEKLSDEKNKVKFKIISLKVKDGVDYVPELVSSSDILNLLGPEMKGQPQSHIARIN